jgi:hypothetical protein
VVAGTVFNGKNLETDKRGNVKKFATVFGKRVAATARPTKCVDCECTAFNTGVSYMECYPCTYPMRPNIDYVSVIYLLNRRFQPHALRFVILQSNKWYFSRTGLPLSCPLLLLMSHAHSQFNPEFISSQNLYDTSLSTLFQTIHFLLYTVHFASIPEKKFL